MRRKKKPDPRRKSKAAASKKAITPDLDWSVQVIPPARSSQMSVLQLDAAAQLDAEAQEKPLQPHSPSQDTSLNSVSVQGISQVPALTPLKENEDEHCTHSPFTQSIPPWQERPNTVSGDALHEAATNETVQSPDSNRASNSGPESDFNSQPLRDMSPNIEAGESLATHQTVFESPQSKDILGDLMVCVKRAAADGSSTWSEGHGGQNGGAAGVENRCQPGKIPDLLKENLFLESIVATPQSYGENGAVKGLDSPCPDIVSPLQEQTFQLDVEIFQVENQETREKGVSSQVEEKGSTPQGQDMSFSAPFSVVQADNCLIREPGVELHGDTIQLIDPQLPVLKENATLTAGQEQVVNKFMLQRQDSTVQIEKPQCEHGGQILEETSHSSDIKTIEREDLNSESEINNLQIEPQDSLVKQHESSSGGGGLSCPLESLAVKSSSSLATSSLLADQDVAAAGLEVPDVQVIGALYEKLNPHDQIASVISPGIATASEPNRTHNQKPPAPVPPRRHQSCAPANGKEDASSVVQGLIAELSNLNRLIMSTHRDLRQKRGRFPAVRGSIAGRKKLRKM